LAAWKGFLPLLELLRKRGVDVRKKVKHTSALNVASEFGHQNAVQWLISHGANVNATDGDTLTPLMQAAHGDHVEVVRVLLEHGASANMRGKALWSALDEARAVPGERSAGLLATNELPETYAMGKSKRR
jgi:ankyrin repeat protein